MNCSSSSFRREKPEQLGLSRIRGRSGVNFGEKIKGVGQSLFFMFLPMLYGLTLYSAPERLA